MAKKKKYSFEVVEKRQTKEPLALIRSTGDVLRLSLNVCAVKELAKGASFGKLVYDKAKNVLGIVLSKKPEANTFDLNNRIYANTLVTKYNAPIKVGEYPITKEGNTLVVKL